MSPSVDFVIAAELSTNFCTDHTIHVHGISGAAMRGGPCTYENHWKKDGGIIASGAFGSVWVEKCVQGKSLSQYRAVKRVSKSLETTAAKPLDYHRELEAILKFSEEKYERCFVKSLGWYQNEHSIFIAMEYLEHGSLQDYLDQNPALNEIEAQPICIQLLEGLQFMHENNYSHRDVKPANVLIKSKPPGSWWVKLGDFGFSKRAEDNNTTIKAIRQGTLRYMAPELLDYVDVDKTRLMRDTQAADIWAVGEIMFVMLTKEHAFRTHADLSAYTTRPELFPSVFLRSQGITTSAIAFIARLMRPRPERRPTAAEALLHKWLEVAYLAHITKTTAVVFNEDDHGRVTSTISSSPLARIPISIPVASAQWSAVSMIAPPLSHNRQVTHQRTQATVTVAAVERTQSATATTAVSYDGARYFVIKSYNSINIESSMDRGVWSSNTRDNARLTKAYNTTNGEIFLIFSINQSRRFCGVAAMRSPWQADMTNPSWKGGIWDGGYSVEWLSRTPVSFDEVKHLTVKKTTNSESVTKVRWVTELCSSTGKEMMHRFGVMEGDSVSTQRVSSSQPTVLHPLPSPSSVSPSSLLSQPQPVLNIPPPAGKSLLEQEVLYCRHIFQRGLLSNDQSLSEDQMILSSNCIQLLESKPPLSSAILQDTKIHKVMKLIAKMRPVPDENKYHFRSRALKLVHNWNKVLLEG